MLDTLLEIGQKLRQSPDGLRHHRYIKKSPIGDEKTPIAFYEVIVADDYSFDFSQIQPLKNESRINALFYLNFKNNEADSTKPYVFGDIFRLFIRKQKRNGQIEENESGNFFLGDPENKNANSARNSFLRFSDGYKANPEAEIKDRKKTKKIAVASPLLTPGILKFRASFRAQMPEIVAFLEANPLVYIHFNFGGKGWWELKDKTALENMLLEKFIVSSGEGFVFQGSVYKTISSGGTGTPNFDKANDHKVRLFQSENEVMDLLYALNYAKRATVRFGEIKIIVLPRGENLEARQIERFFEKTGLGSVEDDEDLIVKEGSANANAKKVKEERPANGFDPTFGMLPADEKSETTLQQFDFIFSRDGGGTKPDVDLIEVSAIRRSKLYEVAKRVREAAQETENERDEFFAAITSYFAAKSKDKSAESDEAKALAKAKRPPVFMMGAFLNILGVVGRKQPKYQSHLLKVLPQIYTATYYNDPVLLPAFIEKIEFNIRNGEGLNFNLLKWDLIFLLRLQTNSDRLMDIKNSPSYEVGVLLGQLARGLRSKINSFDKNYAGLISRRIPTMEEVVALHVELDQKLIMHGKSGLAFKVSPLLTNALKNFKSRGEQYNKDLCAFGFFESYFAPYKSKEEEAKEEEPPPLVVVEDSTEKPLEEVSA